MSTILLINGPNLNKLGTREPQTYGSDTLKDVEERLAKHAKAKGFELEAFQSNSEADIIDRVHQAGEQKIDFIIINPAAFTHTSIAIRDALLAVDIPFYEVHISNVYKREAFRHHSYFSDIAVGTVVGLGTFGYEAALAAICNQVPSN